jgi:hypothetical protein
MTSVGFITSRPVSLAESPRDSRRSSAESAKAGHSLKRMAQKTMTAIKRHHQEVNQAFDAVYGTKYYKH